jgi:hypothetical protein
MDQYKLTIDVNGAPSGSEKLAREQGAPLPDEKDKVKKVKSEKPKSVLDMLEDKIGEEKFNTGKKVLGGASAVGFIALDLYQQEKSFQGDSNRNLRVNEFKKGAGIIGGTAMLALSGNYLGAGLFLGYSALQLSKENREIINTMQIDTYQSQYYYDRVVYDITQRSR